MPVHVSPDNFNRAETDMHFQSIVKGDGLGTFEHHRTLVPIDQQTVIRSNRDTLYSAAVFDVDAGPMTNRRRAELVDGVFPEPQPI